jgi:hypothetical protein
MENQLQTLKRGCALQVLRAAVFALEDIQTQWTVRNRFVPQL